ncbi:hypothetical protein B0G69_1200 [Paraburkholderia sp. RAU2J]|uniref:hypothetical protein n=1 Tax=Paraburkholderia sp. RAU2J TaxID=1938810 RepID=UPI000EB4F097|nr:hypothetical protein [Paraburkholderia sp. RAU2J]RKT25484.1 hypothetical protein B0G69_1200 [Paraburkholderia sp. RAU2J]
MEANEYKTILKEHGRRVANRAAYAALGRDAEHSLNGFYAMYGNEAGLPENERCKTGLVDQFDPVGWNKHYSNHPANPLSPIYHATRGASAHWFDQLFGAREFWGDWVIRFLYKCIVLDERIEESFLIVDDQGEFVTVADGCYYCAWFAGWFGWTEWVRSLNADDVSALRLVLRVVVMQEFNHRHPEPGSPEAEAFLEKHKLHT